MSGRIFGTEIEYGCLIESDELAEQITPETLANLVKNVLFLERNSGILDVHTRDWGEPPGNGGFLFNGGRLYLDMGHVEYATPECQTLRDLIAYERAGDWLLIEALDELGFRDDVTFVRNNIDHVTGATFGYHENYQVDRSVHFYQQVIPQLLPFLVTRIIYTGAGRVGFQDEAYWEEETRSARSFATRVTPEVPFQLSQRADHIVTEAYQWVQFSRAIINTRDEPLADPSRYRRVHLLSGDANMSEYATALKVGTTSLVLFLIELDCPIPTIPLENPVMALRTISRDNSYRWLVPLENGRMISAIEVQGAYLALAERYLTGLSSEYDWVIREWRATLEALAEDPMQLRNRLDWVAKRWLMETFIEEEGIDWTDPWLQSIDLEYHKIDPERSLYHDLVEEGVMRRLVPERAVQEAMDEPPLDTRALGRSQMMRLLAEPSVQIGPFDFIVEWDGVYLANNRSIPMRNPFETYEHQVDQLRRLLTRRRPGVPRREKGKA